MIDFLNKVNSQERKVLAIDFDGVIHKNSKGFHDGTVYDEPIAGSLEAIRELSSHYDIVIFSCKALKDRPLINGKTGQELIYQWLEHHNVKKFIKLVTHEKPRAFLYIDDKGYTFTDWDQTLSYIKGVTKS